MVIYKFGGASVKNPEGVENLKNILVSQNEAGVVVLSAFGKTTNQLEKLIQHIHRHDQPAFDERLRQIKDYHWQIMDALFDEKDPVREVAESYFAQLQEAFGQQREDFDFLYDQVICTGELLSTTIVSAYLNRAGVNCRWVDVRNCLITDDLYREARIDWLQTHPLVEDVFQPAPGEVILTQGFIGGTRAGWSTSLGREGSDYTAAILANILKASKVVIWKDVPGVLNADPRFFSGAEKLEKISYQEALELSYYGAKIIHPKTIKPLQNRGIPLNVRSFIEPEQPGTWISTQEAYDGDKPIYILKPRQVLISILPKDFSFVVEERLSKIYGLFAKHRLQVNMMQNSALNFTVCLDEHPRKVEKLMEDLKKEFRVLYNNNLQLSTVRHYNEKVLDSIQQGRRVLVEQRSRHTAQFLMESSDRYIEGS
jgi:aspartate kinase